MYFLLLMLWIPSANRSLILAREILIESEHTAHDQGDEYEATHNFDKHSHWRLSGCRPDVPANEWWRIEHASNVGDGTCKDQRAADR